MAELIEVVRLTLRYGAGAPEIVGQTLIRAVDPAATAPPVAGRDGVWLVVRDADRRETFRRALPDPASAREVADADGAVASAAEAEDARLVMIEAPWPGEGATVSVEIGRDDALESAPLLLSLAPRRVIALEGAGSPLVVHPIWGANNARALTLLFLPDGFHADEMTRFHDAIERCVDLIGRSAPFDRLTAALRVAHADIVSHDSGIVGTQPRDTAFRSRFDARIARLIVCDQHRALDALDDLVPGSGVAIVVANTAEYGGSGGAAPVFSCDASAAEIALHELGHSRFGLADEYSDAGQSSTDDPVEPNVSGRGDRAHLKWACLVPPETPLPTWRVGDPIPTPPPAGTGAFEGAKYHVRDRFRPAFDCRMRTLGASFCAVCRETITAVLTPHLPQLRRGPELFADRRSRALRYRATPDGLRPARGGAARGGDAALGAADPVRADPARRAGAARRL